MTTTYMTKRIQNIRTTIFRSLMVVAMIVCGVGHSWGTDYVIYNNGNYLCCNGSLTTSTTFNPSTCIWTSNISSGSAGTFSISYNGTTYYLRYNNNQLTVTSKSSNKTTFYMNDSGQLCQSASSYNWWGTTYYYNYSQFLNYSNGWNVNGSAQDNIYAVTTGTDDPSITITGPSITPASVSLNYNDSQEFKASDATATTIAGCTTYTFNSTTHYYYNSTDYTTLTEYRTAATSHPDVTYNWTLSGDANSYLSPTSGTGTTITITHSTQNSTDDDKISNLSVTATVNGASSTAATATVTALYPRTDPTSLTVSSTSQTIYAGETFTITPTLTPDPCYTNVTYASSNESVATVSSTGVVAGVALGDATITVTAKKIDGTTTSDLTKTVSVTVKDKCATPTITASGLTCTFSCSHPTSGVTFRYTIDGDVPTSTTGTVGSSVILDSYNHTIRVIATADGYDDSEVAELEVTESASGSGTESDPYLISSATQLNDVSTKSNVSSAYIRVTNSFTASSFTQIANFSGNFDGGYYTISGLSKALFSSVSGGIVKNVRVKDVSISANSNGNAGSIANEATGAKIYNCGVLSGSVSGSNAVGGIVGSISATKVINCYNYATISGGTYAAGVVGRVTDAIPYNHTDDGTSMADWSRTSTNGETLGGNFGANNTNKPTNYSGSLIDGTFEAWYSNTQGTNFQNQEIRHSALTNLPAGNYTVSLILVIRKINGNPSTPSGIQFYLNGDATDFYSNEVATNNNNYYELHINRSVTVAENGSIEFGFNLTNANFNWMLWDNVVVSNGINSSTGVIVANCVNYATDVSGTNYYPVYGGNNLDNKTQPLYDFFLYDGVKNFTSTNSALPAEARFFNRFEYVRATLNAERKLMAYYLWGTQPKSTENEVGKWVLDKTIAPYPIIKPQGKYPSLINPDFESRYVGHLPVTISGYSGTVSLPITDQKEDEFDYGYHKVQLPYYNDYFDDNYGSKGVVTGWKITSVSGGTAGSFSKDDEKNAYNFADRNCTQKDLYSVSRRVFAQGGFYYVPENVTAITIEPYWAVADSVVYVCDPNIDKVFGMGYSETNYGDLYSKTCNIPSNAKIEYSLRAAHNRLAASTNVYGQAIVLIGNLNARCGEKSPVDDISKAYTLMSIDEDRDNEPDYCEYYGHQNMQNIPPTRLDFVYQVGVSWVKKPMGETLQSYSGIAMTSGQFEITETAFARFTEFETGDHDNYKAMAPLIFNGGLIDQFVTYRYDTNDKVNYAILGGHTYFKAYTPGCHATTAQQTTFFPVSVMGGEYDEFYLTGRNANVNVAAQNGRVYTNGGKIGTFAGGYWERLNGNAYIRFDHTQVNEFYGGSVNPAKPITGNIDIVVNNSNVGFFCGGPKAGNMIEGNTVTTVANNTTFGTFVGAGYGGSSVARIQKVENVNSNDYEYYKNKYYFPTYFDSDYLQYSSGNGILIRYAIEFMPGSGGMGSSKKPTHVTRFFDDYAQLSLARTYNVTSTLTGCTVTGNYYGGPWSGTVGTGSGTTPTVTSTLTNCTVRGSVFGGGKSAEIPKITVYPKEASALKTPLYDGNYGVYYQEGETEFPVYPTGTEYTWVAQTGTPTADQTNHTLGTDVDLTNLGTIFGNTSLTIDGGSVAGSVYGAGDASKVNGDTKVTIINDAAIAGNVFGGGNEADCGGSTKVNIEGGTVSTAVYGGGALANVTGNTEVNLNGGTVNDVYGGGLGRQAVGTEGQTGYVEGIAATVGSTTVNVGSGTVAKVDEDATGVTGSCIINGSVFGCNNLNGTPTGDATVNVFRTNNPTYTTDTKSYNSKINAVYGGGNKAAYIPTNTDLTSTNGTHVNIYTCRNQIDYVYGGGNAASSPATNLLIWGGKFDWVFGGGNGKTEEGQPTNPGANVGYYTDTDPDDVTSHGAAYCSGVASTSVHDGIINHLFGGSNTRGNIRTSSITELDDKGCDFTIGEVYAAGNEAYQDGTAILNIGCIPGLGVLYGGARKANINNDIQLTIKGGTYGQIFGGNNESGNINGSITVNIEETGCNPVVIGEIYGGGNLADYEAPKNADGTYKQYPMVNVRSCTSIGTIYGAGCGDSTAKEGDLNYKKGKVTGKPTVNIMQVPGKHAAKIDANGDNTADNNANALGTIGGIFGGGNAADVDGDTFVNIGFNAYEKSADETINQNQTTFVSADADDKSWTATKDITGANIQPVTVTIDKNITGGEEQTYTGTGNVFGGGNNAEVTGKTNVVIGADK